MRNLKNENVLLVYDVNDHVYSKSKSFVGFSHSYLISYGFSNSQS